MSQTSVLAQVEKEEREKLIDEVEQLEVQNKSLELHLKDADGRIEELEEELEDLQQILEKAQESGQHLKDALLQAEQDKIALQLRVAKLEADLAEHKDKDYASYRSMAKYCMSKDDELNELAQKCLAERKAKTSVELKLKCVEGERDRYKEERDKAEKEVKRLQMLMDELVPDYSSDE